MLVWQLFFLVSGTEPLKPEEETKRGHLCEWSYFVLETTKEV